ncbi:unnamed protein product [Pedinophyceae sp. YPF-701]|nr:unnamed protein product [Pedinophyceae sp. YPF-701]
MPPGAATEPTEVDPCAKMPKRRAELSLEAEYQAKVHKAVLNKQITYDVDWIWGLLKEKHAAEAPARLASLLSHHTANSDLLWQPPLELRPRKANSRFKPSQTSKNFLLRFINPQRSTIRALTDRPSVVEALARTKPSGVVYVWIRVQQTTPVSLLRLERLQDDCTPWALLETPEALTTIVEHLGQQHWYNLKEAGACTEDREGFLEALEEPVVEDEEEEEEEESTYDSTEASTASITGFSALELTEEGD